MSPDLTINERKRLEAAAKVPALKRDKAEYELSRPVLPTWEVQVSRSVRRLGWAIFYCAAFAAGGALAILWGIKS